MKRLFSVMLALGLVFGVVASADAAKKKKPKPVPATLYFHGTETVGEVDLANNFATGYNKMDTAEPAGDPPKSLQFTTWAGDPQMWNDCAASHLLPVWTGSVSGQIVGDMKVTLHTFSAPKQVTVQIWPDLMTQTCASNDVSQGQYPTPAAEATVDLPAGPGETEIVLEDVNFKAVGILTLQILPQGPLPGRVLYDSADYASRVEFTCIPKSGNACTY